ncbi:MAG TPA: carbohydrate kinase family protein [Thermomicrobiales bacterium]|nr:carbohydrate kinase family protein [Thermomicrobiales bacterium]
MPATQERRRPRIAAVGLASWDRIIEVERYPAPGSYAIVSNTASLPGGTTFNSAVALSRLGADVALVALVGEDAEGDAIRQTLAREGVDTRWLTTVPGATTDGATVIVSAEPCDRTIYWHQGARLVRGNRLDIAAIFAHDVVLLDVDDAPLRRFLVDLPAHTRPDVRVLGTLTYLVDAGIPDAFDVTLRHDVVVGNRRELCALTGQSNLDSAIATVQTAMPGANLRAGVVTRGGEGATAFTRGDLWDAAAFPIDAVDTTGAGDAFAGAIAYAMALRWDWPAALRFANAVAGLSTRTLGSQTALPSLPEVAKLLDVDPSTLT